MSHAALAFDTLKYAKRLKTAGFTEQQAEVQAEAMKEQSDTMQDFIDERLATKDDIKRLELELKRIEERLTYKLGGMIVGGVVVLSSLITILKFV